MTIGTPRLRWVFPAATQREQLKRQPFRIDTDLASVLLIKTTVPVTNHQLVTRGIDPHHHVHIHITHPQGLGDCLRHVSRCLRIRCHRRCLPRSHDRCQHATIVNSRVVGILIWLIRCGELAILIRFLAILRRLLALQLLDVNLLRRVYRLQLHFLMLVYFYTLLNINRRMHITLALITRHLLRERRYDLPQILLRGVILHLALGEAVALDEGLVDCEAAAAASICQRAISYNTLLLVIPGILSTC